MSNLNRNKLPENIGGMRNDGAPIVNNDSHAKNKESCVTIESYPMPKEIQEQIDAAFKKAAEERAK